MFKQAHACSEVVSRYNVNGKAFTAATCNCGRPLWLRPVPGPVWTEAEVN